jgi:hypothetical protein
MHTLLQTLIESMSTTAHLQKYPILLEQLTVDRMTMSNQQFAAYYKVDAWLPLRPLVKLIFSGSGSSASTLVFVFISSSDTDYFKLQAGAEQAFSSSGRIDAPLRNRLHPVTLEKLTSNNIISYQWDQITRPKLFSSIW